MLGLGLESMLQLLDPVSQLEVEDDELVSVITSLQLLGAVLLFWSLWE